MASVALASSDMYSAAVGYVTDLAKTGKLASKTALKTSLKETLQEGFEQGSRNIDNFKTVLKNVDDFGKRVLTKIDEFGKQLDNLVTNKVSSLADNVAGKLRHAVETISTAARNFRLNIGLEPQLIDGFMPTPPPGEVVWFS